MNRIIENIKVIFVCSLFIFIPSILSAQDNIEMQKEDSSNTAILNDYQKKLEKIRAATCFRFSAKKRLRNTVEVFEDNG